MTKIELTYHTLVILLALIVYFLEFKAKNTYIDIIVNVLSKVISLLVISYSILKIFKHFYIIW